MTMEAVSSRAGCDHLEQRSRLQLRLRTLAPITDVLIIDDTMLDANVLASTLRLLLGHDVSIRHFKQLYAVRQALRDNTPSILFLDDRLGHGTSAETSLEQIRKAGYPAAVIILSGLLTRARRIELLRLGVVDVVHKDDINSSRIAEAILKALETPMPPMPGADGTLL